MFLAACLLILFLVSPMECLGSSIPRPRKPGTIPNPITNPARCGRTGSKSSHICDPDGLLEDHHKDFIEQIIDDTHHVDIGVLLVYDMCPNWIGLDSIPTAAEKFADAVREKWGMPEDSVLVFLSVVHRTVHISASQEALKNLVPSTCVVNSRRLSAKCVMTHKGLRNIIDMMKPELDKMDYGAALATAVVELTFRKDERVVYETHRQELEVEFQEGDAEVSDVNETDSPITKDVKEEGDKKVRMSLGAFVQSIWTKYIHPAN